MTDRAPSSPTPPWKNPGVAIFVVTVVLSLVGWALVFQASQRIPVEQGTLGGLHLRLEEARWILDQMDHGENFQKPSTMMPDMPEWGKQRVTLDLAVENRSRRSQVFEGGEFRLVPELGEPVPPIGAQTGRAEVGPGQTFNTAIHFDFDTTLPHGQLRVEWRRGEEAIYLPVPEPAEHYHLRPRGGEVAFPPRASLVLPLGRSDQGRRLYEGKYGCVACHGLLGVPDSNNIGPHLGMIAAQAGERVEGMPAEQYIYESILEPGAFIAPECKNGAPCAEPTAMPEYASLMNLQDVADVLAYLVAADGETDGS